MSKTAISDLLQRLYQLSSRNSFDN